MTEAAYPNGLSVSAPFFLLNGNPIGELFFFSESQNIDPPNDSVPVHGFRAIGDGFAAIDVAIVPKGTGSFSLNIADGTATGGDKRGLYSVDLQLGRDLANQVASGTGSFLAGLGNKAPGIATGGFGSGNNFPGNFSGGWGQGNLYGGEGSGGWGAGNSFPGAFSKG